MDFFNSGFFWFLEGMLFCIVLVGFRAWMKDRGVQMTLWKWMALICWILFFGFTLAFIGTSLGENEPAAALRGGILFGLLTVLVGVVLARFVFSSPKPSD